MGTLAAKLCRRRGSGAASGGSSARHAPRRPPRARSPRCCTARRPACGGEGRGGEGSSEGGAGVGSLSQRQRPGSTQLPTDSDPSPCQTGRPSLPPPLQAPLREQLRCQGRCCCMPQPTAGASAGRQPWRRRERQPCAIAHAGQRVAMHVGCCAVNGRRQGAGPAPQRERTHLPPFLSPGCGLAVAKGLQVMPDLRSLAGAGNGWPIWA